MKTPLLGITTLLTLTTSPLLAHEGVEIGPNGGHILEFSKNESMHGEVSLKDGKFQIALLDKDMKPVKIEKQTITAITADRDKPEKLPVEVKDNHFIVPMQKGEDYWTIIQFKLSPDTKAVTARLHYDARPCPECKKPEWLCACVTKEDKK